MHEETPHPSGNENLIADLEHELLLRPGNTDTILRLANAYVEALRFHARAREVFATASPLFDNRFQDQLEVATLVYHVERILRNHRRPTPEEVDDLRREVSQRVDQYPNSRDLRKTLGDLRVLAGRPGHAIEQYQRALELGFEDLESIFLAFERKKDELAPDPVALEFFSELTRKIKNQSSARVTPSSLSTPGAEGVALSDEALEEIIARHRDNGQIEDAIAVLERLSLLEVSPRHALRIARLLLDDGRPWEAFKRLREIPMDLAAKSLLNETAAWLEKDDNYDQAVEVLRYINDNDLVMLEAALIHERQIELSSTLELADLHFKNNRYLEAFQQYLQVLQDGMQDVSELLPRIETIVDSGKRVPTQDLFFLSEFFRDRGERFRAVRLLNRVFAFDPDLTEGDWQRISNVVDSVLAAEPTQPPLCLELGRLCLRLGRMDRAIQEFILATADQSLQIEANRCLAQAYAQNGQFTLALEKYRTFKPSADDLHAVYGMLEPLEKTGAKTEVYQALCLISEIDPAYLDVAQRLSKAERHSTPAPAIPSVDPKMRALIGDLALGRYRYVDKVGTGGMGVVYKVFDIKHNCILAMKILRESLASSPKALTRFIREAQYVDQLNHPNIVHIFDFNISKVPGQSFIAMEFVDGPSMRQMLDEVFKDNRSIDQEYMLRILGFCTQICDALQATHKEGIVHRDIKPDNVMVNSKSLVKITDFGILHHSEMNYTPTGAVIGTPRYMSPEQVRGEHIDGRSDIYALGILLYEMLTSAPPFISGDIAFQQINNVPPAPRAVCPLITESLEHIIMKCLAKNPDERYASAKNLQEALASEIIALGGVPPSPARSASSQYRSTAEINATPLAPGLDQELADDFDLD